jgi:hypothetical protein
VLIPSLKSPFLECEPVDAEVDYQVVQEEEFDEQTSTEEEGVDYYLEFKLVVLNHYEITENVLL